MTDYILLNEPVLDELLTSTYHDPFSVLGCHPQGKEKLVRAFVPGAREVTAVFSDGRLSLQRQGESAIFSATTRTRHQGPYQLEWADHNNELVCQFDTYSFSPVLQDYDLHLFSEGRHHHAYRFLGAHRCRHQAVEGVRFAVWAPNAKRISVVGPFNQWDGRMHLMRVRGGSGVWELFIPGLSTGELYKYEIAGADGRIFLKSDPYAQRYEMRPSNASVISEPSGYHWSDRDWIAKRESGNWLKKPMSIYEVHLGSWRRDHNGHFLNYSDLAHQLVEYVKEMAFTHIELLPVTEHPFDDSWGYQATGYFAPTSRFGSPDQLRELIDLCHQNNIGVILDWVPAHFPKDDFSLARFDGTELYEHDDPRRGEHKDWGTLIFNYGRKEVKNFLLASANYWLEEFHLDGLRVDAVASMLYLDYSREHGEWAPNQYGGNENLEAVDFIREMNMMTHKNHPGTVTIAEESTAWPMVSRPVNLGGLGFSMKWNMGWMHDSLGYMQRDPVHRSYHHDMLTFGILYAFTENFVLPFSHDEVVHGKGSMINKMPGDDWQKFANLRLLYTYMYTFPGAKLMFMGGEFGQFREWDAQTGLDWHLTEYDRHAGLQKLVADLNHLYRSQSPLYERSFDGGGFEWLDCENQSQSIICFRRISEYEDCIIVLNFTPVAYQHFRVGVPEGGEYDCLFNSDSRHYGGSDVGNAFEVQTSETPWMDKPFSVEISVPPLAGLVLKRKN